MDGSRSRELAPTSRSRSRRTRRRRLGKAIESLEQRHLLTFAIDLFADVNQVGVSSNIDQLVTAGSTHFFVADDGRTGSELWKTDGTANGTVQVKDVLTGPDTSDPKNLIAAANGNLYFTALDENGEEDIWSSDGTETGTVKVFDADTVDGYLITDLTASGNNIFFVVYDELWAIDTATQASTMVLDTNLTVEFAFDGPQELTDVGGTLFFSAYEGYYNRELWKSDGNANGTMMVKDLGIDPGPDGILGTPDDDASVDSKPTYLTEVNGMLFFAAEDYDNGIELFKSDGSPNGTVMVSDLNTNGSSDPYQLTSFNSQVFFSAIGNDGERHIYRSDGNTIDFVADTTNGLGDSNPTEFEVVGSNLFFAANGSIPETTTSVNQPAITADNSEQVTGFAGLVAGTTSPSQGTLSTFNNSRTFTVVGQNNPDDGPGWVANGARPGANGVGLSSIEIGDLYVQSIGGGELNENFWEWTITDSGGLSNISFQGFASGNQMNNETNEGLVFELFLNGSTTRTSFIEIDGAVIENGGNKNGNAIDNYYATRDEMNLDLVHPGGATITTATVRMSMGIIDGNGQFQERLPDGGSESFVVNAQLTADLGPTPDAFQDAGLELHVIDAATMTPQLVSDIVPGMVSSQPTQLTAVGNKLYFEADDITNAGRELWVTDGTLAGTMRVVDSAPGNDLYGAPLDGAPKLLGSIGNDLIFTTTNSNQDRELWVSNATQMTAQEVLNINTATGDANARRFQQVGDKIYFTANDGVNGDAIWEADTTNGTVRMVADVSPSSTDTILGMTVVPALAPGGELILFYNNSRGTAGGVYTTDLNGNIQLAASVRPVEINDQDDMFIDLATEYYYVTDDGQSGEELWRINAFTRVSNLAFDLNPGTADSSPRELTSFDNELYFVATAGSGRELYSYDGASVNPSLVADIDPGGDSSNPAELTVVGSALFFSASNGTGTNDTGRELYRAVGGNAGIFADVRSGRNSSSPHNLTNVNGTLYFAANNGSNGIEPHRVDGTTVSQVADVNPSGNSNPDHFMEALGTVFFAADNGSDGPELFKTDGTPGGTEQIMDVRPGSGGSNPIPLYDTGQRLLFSASGTGEDDREFWSTDGSQGHAFLLEDLYPSTFFGAAPEQLVPLGDTVYFIGDNGLTGRELFTLRQEDVTVSDLVIGGEPGQPLIADIDRSNLDLVRVVFEGRVDVPAGAIQLRNRTTDTVLTSVQSNLIYDLPSNQTTLELTFGSGPSVRDRIGGNVLEDGNYQLTLTGNLVSSPVSGSTMAADFNFGTVENDNFFAMFGASDLDRDVDGQDYGRLLSTLFLDASDSLFNPIFDFDGDDDTDGVDYGHFLQRLFATLAFA